MGVNRTFFALSVKNILSGAPFYVSNHMDTNTFRNGFFSNSFAPLFFLKSMSSLNLIKSKFTNLHSSIVVAVNEVDTFYDINKNGDLYETISMTGTGSGLLVDKCTAYNLSIDDAFALISTTGPRVHINMSTFSYINNTKNYSSIIYAVDASEVRILNSKFSYCSAKSYGVGYFSNTPVEIYKTTFTNCIIQASTEDNSEGDGGSGSSGGGNSIRRLALDESATEAYSLFYFDNSEVELSNIKVENGNTTDPNKFIKFNNCKGIAINSSEFVANQLAQPVIVMNASTHAYVFASAFVNITKEPLSLTSSSLAVLRACESNNLSIATADENSIVTVRNYTTTDKCNLQYIIVPEESDEETLTDQEKVAQWVTFAVFIVFFVTVFAVLISLIFCNVGMSEDLVFEESQNDEEESFQSFAA